MTDSTLLLLCFRHVVISAQTLGKCWLPCHSVVVLFRCLQVAVAHYQGCQLFFHPPQQRPLVCGVPLHVSYHKSQSPPPRMPACGPGGNAGLPDQTIARPRTSARDRDPRWQRAPGMCDYSRLVVLSTSAPLPSLSVSDRSLRVSTCGLALRLGQAHEPVRINLFVYS